MRKVFEFLNLNFPLKPEPGLQTGAMNYNVLQLGKVATVNDLRSQIYRKVRKKKPDFGEEMQTISLTDKNQA